MTSLARAFAIVFVAAALLLAGCPLPTEGDDPTAVDPPSFSLPAGPYDSGQTLLLSATTPGASIHYTLDGAEPTAASTMYSGPILLPDGTITVKAIAVAPDGTTSTVASAQYTITPAVVAAPTFQIGGTPSTGGTFDSDVTVEVSSEMGTTIYYTTDGTDPTTGSTQYSPGGISIAGPDDSVELRAIAVDGGGTSSSVASATYVVQYPQAASVTLSVPGGTYWTGQPVAVALSTTQTGSNVEIWYTTDASDPSDTGNPSRTNYLTDGTPIDLSGTKAETTIRAAAIASGFRAGPEASATYDVVSYQWGLLATIDPAVGERLEVIDVAHDSSGAPVVAYGSENPSITDPFTYHVARWNGSAWDDYGSPGDGNTEYGSMVIASDDTIYLSGSNTTNNDPEIHVRTPGPGTWSTLSALVGTAGSLGRNARLAIDPTNGDLYAAVDRYDNDASTLAVQRYPAGGSAWEMVGPAITNGEITDDANRSHYVLVDSEGVLSLVYESNAASQSAVTVAQWNGTSWDSDTYSSSGQDAPEISYAAAVTADDAIWVAGNNSLGVGNPTAVGAYADLDGDGSASWGQFYDFPSSATVNTFASTTPDVTGDRFGRPVVAGRDSSDQPVVWYKDGPNPDDWIVVGGAEVVASVIATPRIDAAGDDSLTLAVRDTTASSAISVYRFAPTP